MFYVQILTYRNHDIHDHAIFTQISCAIKSGNIFILKLYLSHGNV